MASKCRNMFYQNKKQETTEIDTRYLPKADAAVPSVSDGATTALTLWPQPIKSKQITFNRLALRLPRVNDGDMTLAATHHSASYRHALVDPPSSMPLTVQGLPPGRREASARATRPEPNDTCTRIATLTYPTRSSGPNVGTTATCCPLHNKHRQTDKSESVRNYNLPTPGPAVDCGLGTPRAVTTQLPTHPY
ncbi:hypothetical protein AAG570_008863 [Ranatra chinensis]|uniref:Uncharacterized protein n=1 Tax=Ranatra chinensis TaxID=642074 RepID=A0ABD0YSS2_9HEMI